MAKFHTLTISDIKHETADCVSLAFDVPKELTSEYNYIQGQYLTLKLNVNGEELRRSYSICSSPKTDNELRVAIKKVAGGKVSTWINDFAKKGSNIEVMTPLGNFHTELKPTNKKKYILFSGGSGITPMMSIIKTTLNIEEKSELILFYGNYNEASTIFKTEIDDLAKKFSERLKVHYVFDKPSEEPSQELLKGLMTSDKIKLLLQTFGHVTPVTEYFICGPGPMMENVKTTLEELNVHKNYIHIEYFTSVIDAVAAAEAASETKPDLASKVKVTMDGTEYVFDLNANGKAILDAAMDAGVDAPFSCKGAVCCTCKAKVMKGKVTMDMNYALSDGEVEEGYILTCQSHPASPEVEVSYDEP